jgi:hypothetical protein
MPYPHNPITHLPRINPHIQVHIFQFRAGLADQLVQWTGGELSYTDDGHPLITIPGEPPVVAGLGDYVASDGSRFWVEPHNQFNERYWPVGRDPGWDHVCRYYWEQ